MGYGRKYILLGIGAILLLTILIVPLSCKLETAKFYYGQCATVVKGFYKGCSGRLAEYSYGLAEFYGSTFVYALSDVRCIGDKTVYSLRNVPEITLEEIDCRSLKGNGYGWD